MTMSRMAMMIAGAAVTAQAAVRSLDSRKAAGECADVVLTSYFEDDVKLTNLPSSMVSTAESVAQWKSSLVELLIDYGPNFKVLTDSMSGEQYVLTQCGTEQPTDDQVDKVKALPGNHIRKHFTIPVQTVVATSSVQLGFLEALGLQDRVTYVADTAVGACWQHALTEECGASLVSAWGGNQTLRSMQLNEAEMVLRDCKSYTPLDCSNMADQSNGVHFAATTGVPGNLHAAEFVKFLAAFFNKEEKAMQFFKTAHAAYMGAAAAANADAVKKVAWISFEAANPGWGISKSSFKVSLAFYKQELVSAAGGVNVNGEALLAALPKMTKSVDGAGNPTYKLVVDGNYNSAQEAAAAFFGALSDVDAVVDENSNWPNDPADYTMTSFLTKMNLAAESTLPFVQNSMVFRKDATVSNFPDASFPNDWFESRIPNPHLAVEGLQRVLLPDSNQPKKFFRNIAAGEGPDYIDRRTCDRVLPFCDDSQGPLAILMLVDSSEVSGASAASFVTAVAAMIALVIH